MTREGEISITRAGHTESHRHKKNEVTQIMLDFLLGPPMHDARLPRAHQLHTLSLRGDERIPIVSNREKGMPGPISRRRVREYWGSHASLFGLKVKRLCERLLLMNLYNCA